ncbi:MAG: diguanylate cyclase, partial [Proteobacteria bacterium]|nr:diguanylate cyclase [Pseudomonadota bacterium]
MSEQEPRPRQRSFNSVSTKIISFVFASTLLTALVVSWISIQSSHAPLQRQIDLLERWEETVQAELDRSVAELADLRPALAAAIRVNHAGPRTQRAFRAFVAGSHRFDALGLLGPNQQWLARVGAAERLSAAAKLDWPGGSADLAEPPASDAAPVTFARLPLADTEWLLVAALRPEALAGLLSSETQRTGSELFLLDGAGRVLAASPPGEGDREQRPRVVRDYTGTNGHHLLASARPVGSLGWTLVVEESFEVAFEPVLSMLTPIFLTDLAIVLVFSVLAWRIKSTILRPIEALSEGARLVSQGQMDHEIPDPGSGDEIGLLTRTFNDMVRKLRHYQIEIEEANFRLTEQYEELLSANEVLAQLSITDGLTKLHNHRYFQDHLTREIKRVGRSGEPLSILLMDLDDFKSLNDRLGHAAGDELLVKISKVMNTSVRESDLLARYGGEEFVVLASGTELEGGVALAEKIRTAVAETPHIVDSSMRPVRLTISVGVAAYEGDRMKFFRDADRALYEAKAEGKNCVVAA